MQVTPSAPSTHPHAATPHAVADSAVAPKELCLDSAHLLLGRKSVNIVHNGAIYRLQATKLGKLILTK